jgi:hypothetical protein
VKESNLPPSASQLDGNGFTGRREEHHPSHSSASSTGGSRTHRIPGFEPGRFAGLRTVPASRTIDRAGPRGVEPRATHGQCDMLPLHHGPVFPGTGSGGIRTLSISRSKREWSAHCLPSRKRCAHRPSTRGGSRTHRHPGLSRAARPLAYPGPARRKPWDSNPQAAHGPPPVFKTGP